jgi:hypothetical protein
MSRPRSFSAKSARAALTNLIALILVYALFGTTVLEARIGISASGGFPTEETTIKPTLQERILEVPNGSIIEVRLMNKQKVRGKLGEVTNEGFSLQTAQGTKVETQQFAFTDVKSFKQVSGTAATKAGHGLVYALAGIGVLTVVLVIVGVAMAGSD